MPTKSLLPARIKHNLLGLYMLQGLLVVKHFSISQARIFLFDVHCRHSLRADSSKFFSFFEFYPSFQHSFKNSLAIAMISHNFISIGCQP